MVSTYPSRTSAPVPRRCSPRLWALRIRLDLRLDGDHGVKRFFGLVLRRRGRRDQGQDHRSQKRAQPTHGVLLYGSTIR